MAQIKRGYPRIEKHPKYRAPLIPNDPNERNPIL